MNHEHSSPRGRRVYRVERSRNAYGEEVGKVVTRYYFGTYTGSMGECMAAYGYEPCAKLTHAELWQEGMHYATRERAQEALEALAG